MSLRRQPVLSSMPRYYRSVSADARRSAGTNFVTDNSDPAWPRNGFVFEGAEEIPGERTKTQPKP